MPNDLQLSDQDEVLLESLVLAASDNVARAPASDRDQYAPERRRAFVETSGAGNVYLGTGSAWVDVSENTGLLSKLFSGGDGNFDSVNTEDINNVLHASKHDGANGREKVQNALDAADSAVGRNKVVVGPDTPDDLSGYAAAGESDGWLIDQAIQIPSNTVVHFDSTYLFLDNQANDNFFRNATADSGDSSRNRQITILNHGTRFHGNPAEQDRDPKDGNTYWNHGFHFYKVDGLTLRGLDIGPTKTYGGCIEDCSQIVVDDYHVRQDGNHSNQDGLHFFGPIDTAFISNIYGTASDDAFVLGCYEIDTYKTDRGNGGNITNVDLDGHKIDTIGSGDSVKLYVNETGLTMDDVSLSNVTAESNSSGIRIGGERIEGEFGDLTLRNWTVQTETFVINIDQDVNLTAKNITGKTNTEDAIVAGKDSGISDVTLRDITVTGDGSNSAIEAQSGTSLSDWTVDGLRANEFSRVLEMEDRPNQATNCTIDNLKVSNVTYPYDSIGRWKFGPHTPADPNGVDTVTLSGGGGPVELTLDFLLSLDHPDYVPLDVRVYPNDNYAFNYDYTVDVTEGTDSDGRVATVTIDWADGGDPGSGNDITFTAEVRPA